MGRTTRCLVLMAGLAGLTAAWGRHTGEYLNDVSTSLRTPHTDWAAPYAAGALKALFITPGTLAPREIVELWQRMPLEFEAVLTEHAGSFAATDIYAAQVEGTTPDEKAAELRRKLQQAYDVIVLANARLDMLPVEFQYEILKRVTEGTGLVMAYRYPYQYPITGKPLDADRSFLTQGIPWSGLPYFRTEALANFQLQTVTEVPERVVRTYQLGRGRLVVLDYGMWQSAVYGGPGLTPLVPFSLDFPVEYEYYLSLAMKALLWASPRHMPRVMLSLAADGQTLPREAVGTLCRLEAENRSDAPLPAEVWTRFRDTRGHETRNTFQRTLQPGPNTFPIQPATLPAGQWFLDVILRGPRGVETWGSTSFVVTAPVELAEFAAATESVERDASVELRARLSTPAPPACSLHVDLVDTEDRVFARHDAGLAVGQQTISLSLPVRRTRTLAVRAVASLSVAGELMSRREAVFYVPQRSSEELRSVLWGTNDAGLWWSQWNLMRKTGFNCFLAHPEPRNFQRYALSDFRPFVYAYRICGGADEKGWRKAAFGPSVGDDSFSNPAWRDAAKAELQKRIAPCPPVGPEVYSLGDENELDLNSGFSPSDEVAFRAFLREQYRTLEDLNESWGTSFASWDDVRPMDRREALTAREYARISDHMSFLEWQYAEIHGAMRDWIHEIDPRAAVGAEGSMPGDLERSLGNLEMWSPYSWLRLDVLQMSLARPEVIYGNWWGGYVGSHGGRQATPVLWEHLLRGLNTSLWFAVTGSEGLLQAGGGFAPYFERLRPQFEEIHSGIGQQIVAADPADDGLYMLWSQVSEHVATWDTGFGTPEASQNALIVAAREIGLTPRFITARGIEQRGELAARKPKVVFILGARAVSGDQAELLRDYCQAGGTVVAEARCGVLGGLGKPAARNLLSDLLGVESDVSATPGKAPLRLDTTLNGQELELDVSEVRVDPSIRVTTAQVLAASADLPLVTINQVGAGRAILLNFPLGDALAGAVPASRGTDLLAALLRATGVAPRVWVEPRGTWEVRLLDNGDAPLVGLLRRKPGPAELRLRQTAHIVDTRTDQYLGASDRLAVAQDEAREVLIYTLLPTKPGDLAIGPKAGKLGQDVTIALKLPGGLQATRIVRVRVTDSQGQERWAYRRYLRMRGTQGEVTIPLAYNDPAGQWTVQMTDISTGATASAKFAVTAGG
ncbi:MAG: hypothetical protein HPY69_11040 [Armatimonadetes bacterium]|nr:hypothetical protein [Armatimonadota bacterium]